MIYLDHHATTPVDARVLQVMLPYFRERFGNAASRQHAFGWAAERAVEKARAQVAALLAARPEEIIFTSGATEACNLALRGLGGEHFIAPVTEHVAVLDTLKATGAALTLLSVDAQGLVTAAQIEKALRPNTRAVCVMAANNEIGVIQPLAEIAALCRARGVLFFCDAAQGADYLPLENLGADLVVLSAHKIYGPKGAGALFVRKGVHLSPLIFGGGHERGLRSGTLDVPAIVGFGAAATLALEVRQNESARVAALRDRLRALVALPGVHENGSFAARLPNNLNISVEGVDGPTLFLALPELAISSGAACASALPEASPVLLALGRSEAQARASLRFGLGRETTAEDIEQAGTMVREAIERLRQENPLTGLPEPAKNG